MVTNFPPKYQTLQRLKKFYIKTGEFDFNSILWTEVFGYPDIFMKIQNKQTSVRILTCPHCGKVGQIAEKTTISKKKYRYNYLYIHHSATKNKRQKWCFLNEDYQNIPLVQEAIRKLAHWQNIEKYFYKSLLLPDS